MRPCDCKDAVMAEKLNAQGVKYNDDELVVVPSCVYLTIGHTKIKISMHRFKQLATWYLTDQTDGKPAIEHLKEIYRLIRYKSHEDALGYIYDNNEEIEMLLKNDILKGENHKEEN